MTQDDTAHDGPQSGEYTRSRAVLAGGGRCWVRTNVGEADGFTDRSSPPIRIATDLAKLPLWPREYLTLSAICPCARAAERQLPRTDTDSVHKSRLACGFAIHIKL